MRACSSSGRNKGSSQAGAASASGGTQAGENTQYGEGTQYRESTQYGKSTQTGESTQYGEAARGKGLAQAGESGDAALGEGAERKRTSAEAVRGEGAGRRGISAKGSLSDLYRSKLALRPLRPLDLLAPPTGKGSGHVPVGRVLSWPGAAPMAGVGVGEGRRLSESGEGEEERGSPGSGSGEEGRVHGGVVTGGGVLAHKQQTHPRAVTQYSDTLFDHERPTVTDWREIGVLLRPPRRLGPEMKKSESFG